MLTTIKVLKNECYAVKIYTYKSKENFLQGRATGASALDPLLMTIMNRCLERVTVGAIR